MSILALINNDLLKLIQGTVKEFVDPKAEVLSIESTPIAMGIQAVGLKRHSVLIRILDETSKLSLVSKHATRIERQVMTWLYSQRASVPFSFSYGSELDERSLICIQDVDYQTDYSNINISSLQKSETKALSHIHLSNFGQRRELSWLPEVDNFHIEKMIFEQWKPQWQVAKENEQFKDIFGDYIPLVEDAANTIVQDIQYVIRDEGSQTLIHNDLNPGNVLVHNNTEVIFIDWEEARYGSLFFDIPLRCGTLEQIEEYRGLLAGKSIEFPDDHFEQMYTIASRYLGLRFMSWNLGAWTSNSRAKEDLKKYLDMVVGASLT
ncbi:aminoglycoside phosphotransferase family protein [Paenibacillus tritici]|uniref:phosphotransferase family protein n=1 Tax=Paenibacillus tritici TaxID=1873425 RepID=UPI001BADEAAE|nr:aminoglycoside phosphotransferase family protein [Paenibacillus tritici]QUL52323.1 aminoglycoside phosphotransferase family protein [Paenibacillus tritici]